MTGTPATNEARGKARLLLQQLEAEAARITAAAHALPRREIHAVGAFRKTSEPALDALAARMPLPAFYRERRRIGWRFLEPVAVLPDVVQAVPGVMMKAVLVGALGRPGLSIEPFGLCLTLHSLHRLFDRGSPSVDPVQAMTAAHDALIALGPIEGAQVFDLPTLTLPTPGGAFLAHARIQRGRDLPMVTAKTWVADGQTHEDQDSELRAWRALLEVAA